ncbi:MAG: zinc-binding dehydrogenase [Roseiflexaceae bacterium]
MSIIRGIVVDPQAAGRLAVLPVELAAPAPSEALVRVAAISLNRGELRAVSQAAAGTRPGWDFAGIVGQAAADGSGPAAGTRVVGFLRAGAWAEVIAAPAHALAALPDTVSFAQAATLPIAGLSALYALERGGSLLARNVLITGATGGVGLFACQLARMAGARVVALVRRAEQAASVRDAGAHEVVVSADGAAAETYAPYDVIVDSVGGRVLGSLMGMLRFGGVCVALGASEHANVTFDVRRFFSAGGSLYGFLIFNEVTRRPVAAGLARLAGLVAEGRLHTSIAVEAPWTEIASVAQQLLDRQFAGKAVLLLGD